MFSLLIPAISLGLLSSFHCLGMCGPIAFALPVSQKNKASKIVGISLYNVGRVITYSTLGLLVGFFGEGLRFMGVSQTISIVLGVLLILSVVFSKYVLKFSNHNKYIYQFNAFVKAKLGVFLNKKSNTSLFLIGILNGLIPCGVVFIALQGSLIQTNLLNSWLFMLVFGLGTIPMMFSIAYLSNTFSPIAKIKINKLMPYLTVVIALLLIVRGLNLDIPYLSPSYDKQTNEMSCCHKPE
ncbi:MAG: sulfite exporter TauE/SafE family protein [Flavobacteriales bacterium]|nr:sulfite exporter TauE/SafE family protein [Flavobacteriales bacterium]